MRRRDDWVSGALTINACCFPTDQMLTFLSSPPVARTLPLRLPRWTQFTGALWATNSHILCPRIAVRPIAALALARHEGFFHGEASEA